MPQRLILQSLRPLGGRAMPTHPHRRPRSRRRRRSARPGLGRRLCLRQRRDRNSHRQRPGRRVLGHVARQGNGHRHGRRGEPDQRPDGGLSVVRHSRSGSGVVVSYWLGVDLALQLLGAVRLLVVGRLVGDCVGVVVVVACERECVKVQLGAKVDGDVEWGVSGPGGAFGSFERGDSHGCCWHGLGIRRCRAQCELEVGEGRVGCN
jgi:hypothetical protein